MATITNLDSLRTLAGLSQSSRAISQASERISTGLRVNRASDDPAGMAVANDLKTQLTSYNQILTNVAEGQTVTNLVDSSLSQMVDLLGYMRVAAVAADKAAFAADKARAKVAAPGAEDGAKAAANESVTETVGRRGVGCA